MAERTALHATHEPETIAELAAGDLRGAEAERAGSLVAECADCAELHADLVAIAGALLSVPPPIRSRPRDFRLSDADAARLRAGSALRRFLRPFAGRSFAFARTLGSATAAIGLAVVLVSASGLVPGGGAGQWRYLASETDLREGRATPIPLLGPAATADAGFAGPTPKATVSEPTRTGVAADAVLPAGVLLLALGLSLVTLRWLARRVAGP